MVTFNERAKEKRKELKLTQAQLAKLAGIPHGRLSFCPRQPSCVAFKEKITFVIIFSLKTENYNKL